MEKQKCGVRGGLIGDKPAIGFGHWPKAAGDFLLGLFPYFQAKPCCCGMKERG